MKKQYPEEKSNLKLLAASILLALVFSYCVWGAVGGELTMPGRSKMLVLPGLAAWIACLFAPLLFAGEFMLHSDRIDMPSSKRRVLHAIFVVLAIVSALCAALWHSSLGPWLGS